MMKSRGLFVDREEFRETGFITLIESLSLNEFQIKIRFVQPALMSPLKSLSLGLQ